MKNQLYISKLAVAVVCFTLAGAQAGFSGDVDLINNALAHHLVATGDQPLSPGVWVELNPCPLPPGGSVLDLADASNPIFRSTSDRVSTFQLVFGAEDIYGAVNFPAGDDGISPPDGNGEFSFDGEDAMGHSFHVAGNLHLGGPGGPQQITDWVALNPCPLPPGSAQYPFGSQLPKGLLQMNFDPQPVTAEFHFTITIDKSSPLFFQSVSIPTPDTGPSVNLLILSGASLVLMRLRHRLAR